MWLQLQIKKWLHLVDNRKKGNNWIENQVQRKINVEKF